MGLRFRKSISIIPGVKLNFGKTGMSVSTGVPGFRKTFHTSGRVTTSVGIPGTGLYYVDTKNTKTQNNRRNTATRQDKANLQVASFKAGKETLLFLPDKLFIMQGSKIGALNYSDITFNAHTTRFIESESVPRDAQVVGQTWKYVNKSGGPDRRFKDNRQLPICLYGELELKSISGLNTVIMYSNANI